MALWARSQSRLRLASVPEREPDYWEEFPKAVLRQVAQGRRALAGRRHDRRGVRRRDVRPGRWRLVADRRRGSGPTRGRCWPGPGSPTLDRIVPSLGYVPGNVVVISHKANSIKSNATAAEIRAVADWLDDITRYTITEQTR